MLTSASICFLYWGLFSVLGAVFCIGGGGHKVTGRKFNIHYMTNFVCLFTNILYRNTVVFLGKITRPTCEVEESV